MLAGGTNRQEGANGTVELWDATTGTMVRTLPTGSVAVNLLMFSPDAAMLATTGLGTVELWDVATGKMTASLPTGSDEVESMAFSPDGTVLATGDDGGTVELWDVATGQQIISLDTLSGGIEGLVFTQHGASLNLIAAYGLSPFDTPTDATTTVSGLITWSVTDLTGAPAQLCAQVDGARNPAGWEQYVPAGVPYQHNACGGS
jgi:WD40 repeat protein